MLPPCGFLSRSSSVCDCVGNDPKRSVSGCFLVGWSLACLSWLYEIVSFQVMALDMENLHRRVDLGSQKTTGRSRAAND